MEGLIDVFSHADLFRVDTRPNASWGSVKEGTPTLFESARFNGSPGRRLGESAIVDYATFKSLFNAAAAGVLQQVRMMLFLHNAMLVSCKPGRNLEQVNINMQLVAH